MVSRINGSFWTDQRINYHQSAHTGRRPADCLVNTVHRQRPVAGAPNPRHGDPITTTVMHYTKQFYYIQ